tara:strand:+ start:632 stop:874 length:243 start_codon:yes stop_codon:yes gene_type:complete
MINTLKLYNEATKFTIALVFSIILLMNNIKFSTISGICILLFLTTILYTIFNSLASSEISLSLPFSTYPSPPHLGHAGLR